MRKTTGQKIAAASTLLYGDWQLLTTPRVKWSWRAFQKPHQGAKECARRRNQIAVVMIKAS